jgi:hypothetical protein
MQRNTDLKAGKNLLGDQTTKKQGLQQKLQKNRLGSPCGI